MADRNDSEVPAVVLREHEGLVGDIRFFKTQQWEIAKATVAIYVGLAAATGMMTPPKGSNIALVLRFAFTICAFLGSGFRAHTNSKTIGFDNRSPKKTWHRPRADGYRAPRSFGLNTGRSEGKLLTEVTSIMNLVLIIGMLIVLYVVWQPVFLGP